MNIFLGLAVIVSAVANMFLFLDPPKTVKNEVFLFLLFTVMVILLSIGVYENFKGKL